MYRQVDYYPAGRLISAGNHLKGRLKIRFQTAFSIETHHKT